MTSDRAYWRGAESVVRSAHPGRRNCQVPGATLESHDPCSGESAIDGAVAQLIDEKTSLRYLPIPAFRNACSQIIVTPDQITAASTWDALTERPWANALARR